MVPRPATPITLDTEPAAGVPPVAGAAPVAPETVAWNEPRETPGGIVSARLFRMVDQRTSPPIAAVC